MQVPGELDELDELGNVDALDALDVLDELDGPFMVVFPALQCGSKWQPGSRNPTIVA